MLSPVSRTRMEVACCSTLTRYVTAIDAKDWMSVGSLFSANAVFKRTNMAPLIGPSQICGYFAQLDAERRDRQAEHLTRHLITTASITCVDPTHAKGISYVLVFRDPQKIAPLPSSLRQPEILIEYHDTFESLDEDCRILSHDARHIFRSSAFREPSPFPASR